MFFTFFCFWTIEEKKICVLRGYEMRSSVRKNPSKRNCKLTRRSEPQLPVFSQESCRCWMEDDDCVSVCKLFEDFSMSGLSAPVDFCFRSNWHVMWSTGLQLAQDLSIDWYMVYKILRLKRVKLCHKTLSLVFACVNLMFILKIRSIVLIIISC